MEIEWNKPFYQFSRMKIYLWGFPFDFTYLYATIFYNWFKALMMMEKQLGKSHPDDQLIFLFMILMLIDFLPMTTRPVQCHLTRRANRIMDGRRNSRVNWRQAHHNTIGNWLFVIKWRCWIINSQEVVTPYIIIYINADYIVDLRYSSNDLMMTQWKYSGMTRYSADIKIVIILLKYSDRSASWQPTKERTFFESSWACGTELKNQWLNTHFIKINEWWKNKFDRINVR